MKEMSKKLDIETKKAERDGAKVKQLETDMTALTKEKGIQCCLCSYKAFDPNKSPESYSLIKHSIMFLINCYY